ncbi:MAG: SAM-dependent methyltransferase [Mycobacterium sp.]
MTTQNPSAQTAFGPIVLSAIEHHEPPDRRLVDDDLAASFLPTGRRLLVGLTRAGVLRRILLAGMDRSGPGVWASLLCRKRYIDERLSDPINEFDTVVLLGAGGDTRAYRIARHSELPVFEVDQPINIDRKAAVVQRVLGAVPSSVHLVPVDFETDDLMSALEAHGYRASSRTFFIWEGVTQYLTPEAVRATLRQLSGAAAGSRLIFTYVRQDFIDGTQLYGADSLYRRFRQRTQVWKSGLVPEEVGELLAEYDWRLVEQVGPSYFRDTYIRPTGRELSASPIEWTALAER